MNACPTCGKDAKRTYCSRPCWRKVHNSPERNAKVARESAEKVGNALRGRGNGKAYRKRGGRHEHRVVAEQKLGRPLLPGEVVHHIDGDKLNNAPANIEVFPSQAEHARHHMLQRLGRA